MAEIQMSGKKALPLYVPQGRPQIRTNKPDLRPEWLDRLRRPVQIVGNADQCYQFIKVWRFDNSEWRHVLLVNDIVSMPISIPILTMPGAKNAAQGTITALDPLAFWEQKGGVIIDIPVHALLKPFQFMTDDNMAACSWIEIAKQRHLESLNRR